MTYTPTADANGADSFTFKANDGQADSNTATVELNIAPVNDAPSFTKGADQTVAEDSGAQTRERLGDRDQPRPGRRVGADGHLHHHEQHERGVVLDRPAVAPDGTLTYTPAADAFGIAAITLRADDSGGAQSATQTFNITVTPVNDAPSFTKGADQTVLEDAGAQTVTGWATAISAGPANESGQTVIVRDHGQHERGAVLGRAGGGLERDADLHAGGERVRHRDDHAEGGRQRNADRPRARRRRSRSRSRR